MGPSFVFKKYEYIIPRFVKNVKEVGKYNFDIHFENCFEVDFK